MSRLTLEDLFNEIKKIKASGIDLSSIPVTLGDDEEFNGVHTAYFMQMVNAKDNNDDLSMEKMCEDALSYYDFVNNKEIKYDGKTFLIS